MTFRGHYRYSSYGHDCDNRIGTIFPSVNSTNNRQLPSVIKVLSQEYKTHVSSSGK